MKKTKLVFLVTMVCVFNSCVMTKSYTDEEKKMRVGDEKVLVLMSNGSQLTGNTISFPSGKKAKQQTAKVDGNEIDLKDVIAYQDKSSYYARFGNDKDYMWVKQLKRGKINLFYYDVNLHSSSFNGQKMVTENTTTTHFVFQKGEGKLLELSIGGITDMLSDNIEARNRFTKQFGSTERRILPKQLQNHPKVVFDAVDIYNGNK